MGQRRDLHSILEGLEKVKKAYFQAPSQDKMEFPCIAYEIDSEDVTYADNNPYNRTLGYQVTVIDRDPDSDIPRQVASLSMSSFRRRFVTDGLNHTVYKLFF